MKTTQKGFTLIELLIVIAIIGILAVAFVPSIMGAPSKGRDAARLADLSKLQKVLINGDLESIPYPGVAGAGDCVDSTLFAAYLPALGGAIPEDPLGTNGDTLISGSPCDGEYGYVMNPESAGTYSFGLYATMETVEAGNTLCSSFDTVADTITTITGDGAEDDSCYVILSE